MNLSPNHILALEAAIEAGIAIRQIYTTKVYEIEMKEDDSPVTKADKKSSSIIAGFMERTKIPLIDEEHCCPDYSIRRHWKDFWLVDPMDGTREFISGNGEFTVNIALIENRKPVFGVIYAPVTGELYWGGETTGSFKALEVEKWEGSVEIRKKAIKLIPEEHPALNLRVAASRSHLDTETRTFIENLQKKSGNIAFTSKGSSLKLCTIAEGSTDLYPRFSRTMEWDTAAGHAIVLGTGGKLMRREDQKELEYNKEDLANPPFLALSGLQLKKGLEYF